MIKSIKKYLLFGSLISISLISCDDTGINNDIDNIIIPSQNVSYAQYIQPVFNYKCTNSACHNSETRASGLDLTTWSGTVADPLVVSPGFPETSKIIWAVEGNSGSSPMPPPYGSVPPLTENQIEGLRTWILEGANPN